MSVSLPIQGSVKAGWPSPAEEETSEFLRIDEWLLINKEATVMVEVSGYAMQDAGILAGDFVLLERGRNPKQGDVVIAKIDDTWRIRYYQVEQNKIVLYPANGRYSRLVPQYELVVLGVVTSVIRKYH